MPQWEYKVATITSQNTDEIESALKLFGQDGWEVISVVYEDGDWTFFLKQPASSRN